MRDWIIDNFEVWLFGATVVELGLLAYIAFH